MVSGPITSWQIYGETMETVTDFIFWGSKITVDSNCSHEIKRYLLLGRKAMTNLESKLKTQRHYFAKKGPHSQSYGFSSNHVWIWELKHKESCEPNNCCSRTVVLQKTLEHTLDFKDIKLVNPKGNKSWIFIGRTHAEAETPILGPPDARANSLQKTLMLGRIEGRRRRGLQRTILLDGITDSVDMSLSTVWEIVKDREGWRAAVHGVRKSWTQHQNNRATQVQPRNPKG